MDKLKQYLLKRQRSIIDEIKVDNKIGADNYSNVGKLKEIEKIIKLVNQIT